MKKKLLYAPFAVLLFFSPYLKAEPKILYKPLEAVHDSISIFDGPEKTAVEALIAGFMLIDAETNQEIREISHGDIIYVTEDDTRKFNIAIIPVEGNIEGANYVDLQLTGALEATRRESFAPHAVFGDVNGDYFGRALPVGDYVVTATPFSNTLGQLDGSTIMPFSVKLKKSKEIIDFEIKTNLDKGYGDIIIYDKLLEKGYYDKTHLDDGTFPPVFWGPSTILVNTAEEFDGSIFMELDGPKTYSRTENIAPFALFGDNQGVFNFETFPEGVYTLKATPYSQDNKQGARSETILTTFTVVDYSNRLSPGAFLLDAELDIIISGFVGNCDACDVLGPIDQNNINFQVINWHGNPTSVEFELEGPITYSRTEYVAPYTLFGDIDGDYFSQELPPGDYKFIAIPKDVNSPSFRKSIPTEINFSVIDESYGTANKTKNYKAMLYPNPATSSVTLSNDGDEIGDKTEIFNSAGIKVKEVSNKASKQQTVDVSDLRPGVYFIKAYTKTGTQTKKLIVQ